MDEQVKIIGLYTNELLDNHIQDFFNVYTNVYGKQENLRQIFYKKYFENPYGESLILFAYIEDCCVAIQAFLRNDLEGNLAYQSGDSATTSACRGKGIFSALVKKGIELLPKNAIIYGFPNNNSLPVFKKMGWAIGDRQKTGLLFGQESWSCLEKIDIEYLLWMAKGRKNIYYFEKNHKILILVRKKWNAYQTLGSIEKEELIQIKDILKKATFPVLFTHKINGTLGIGLVPISLRKCDLKAVRLYKLDVLLN